MTENQKRQLFFAARNADSFEEFDRAVQWDRLSAPTDEVGHAPAKTSYVDWSLVERMRNAEEIDSEEAGMLGAMIDGQASQISYLRALLEAPVAPTAEQDKRDAEVAALQKALRSVRNSRTIYEAEAYIERMVLAATAQSEGES